jgi:23S rRNA (guanine745-N1)-methyltransferase
MVRARAEFLELHHFDFIGRALAAAAGSVPGARVVADAGAGTGHHLATVLAGLAPAEPDPAPVGLALDVSAHAARRAARAHPRIGAVVCDVWHALPVAGGVVDVLLNVFAPRNGPEYRRVLAPEGRLLVVTPTPRHLVELIEPLGLLKVDERKSERLGEALGDAFGEESSVLLETTIQVDRDHIPLLALMGPSAWHLDPGALGARAARLPERVDVTASCRLGTYRPLTPPPRPEAPAPSEG